jgi:hypothetical protein
MIAALAVLTAAVTPLLLFVAYCRSLLASTWSVELREHAGRAMGVEDGITSADGPGIRLLRPIETMYSLQLWEKETNRS